MWQLTFNGISGTNMTFDAQNSNERNFHREKSNINAWPKSSLALLALHLIQGSQDRLTLQKVKVCAASSAFIRSDMKYSKDVFAHHEKSPPASHAYSAGKSWPKTSRLWQQWSSWRQFNFKVWRCVRLQTLELGGELSWWLSRSLTSKLDDAAAQQFGNLSLENQSRV